MIRDAQYCRQCDAWVIYVEGNDVVNWLKVGVDVPVSSLEPRGNPLECPCCGLLCGTKVK